MRSIPVFLLASLLAAEADGAILRVSTTGSGTNPFTWAGAFPSVSGAIDSASAGDQIWVASGRYNEAIQLTPKLSLFGGFTGTEAEGEFDLRDWHRNECVLDGSGLGSSVVIGATGVVLDGFTITGGRAGSEGGGGIRCASCSIRLVNLLITRNRVAFARGTSGGGGILCRNASATIVSCTVSFNSIRTLSPGSGDVSARGGGILCESSNLYTGKTSVVGNYVHLAESDSEALGGGLYLRNSITHLGRTKINENVVTARRSNNGRAGGGLTSAMRLSY